MPKMLKIGEEVLIFLISVLSLKSLNLSPVLQLTMLTLERLMMKETFSLSSWLRLTSDMALNISNEQLNAAQKHLADVNAESILQLLPFHQRLMSAQTEQARSQAALFLSCRRFIRVNFGLMIILMPLFPLLFLKLMLPDASALRATFNAALESGDWSALGRDSGINKVAAHIVSALMIAFKIPFSGLAAIR